jgi:uncharacterized protein YndB with AHSA1/START domain
LSYREKGQNSITVNTLNKNNMSKMQTTINKETLELTMTREFDAPRQMVWEAYTNPEMLAKWWGPRGFNTEVKEMSVQVGGRWVYIMHGNGPELKGTQFEGMEAGGIALYQEIKAPELLVYKDIFADKDGNEIPDMPVALITTRFAEQDGKTIMTSTTKYSTLEDLEKVVSMGVEEGMGQTLDRLDELLTQD